jgi:lipoprotein-releasing system ATP-binding protein
MGSWPLAFLRTSCNLAQRGTHVLEVTRVSKDYQTPSGPIRVLSDIDLSVGPGQSISIVGPSGSGKSTLLYILGALEPPSSGTVLLGGQNPFELDDRQLAAFRNRHVGFVFQDHHLLPQCSVLENVLVPTLVAREAVADVEQRALDLIQQVGLTARLHHRPHELSGGEKQRVALARALVQHPGLVLCDEPTGNLDQESADTIASLLVDLHKRQQSILIVVTHNLELAQRMDTRYMLGDARLVAR